MDTEKCAALLCVLESGSITAAAEKLGYTVSGVSRMMASMEAECGFPLLVRGKNGVMPTADCEDLLPTIKELARMGRLYEERCSAVRGLDTGVIRLTKPEEGGKGKTRKVRYVQEQGPYGRTSLRQVVEEIDALMVGIILPGHHAVRNTSRHFVGASRHHIADAGSSSVDIPRSLELVCGNCATP